MERIEVNVETGEVAVVPLTAEEIADAQSRAAAEPAIRAQERQAAAAELVNRVVASPEAVAMLKSALGIS